MILADALFVNHNHFSLLYLRKENMTYPTAEYVEKADKIQLARYARFLPSPGQNFIGTPQFETKLKEEVKIQTRILERFAEMGGWNPMISKLIGLQKS